METFQKGMKTVVSGTMLAGLDIAGVTRPETPTGRGLQAGRSPHGMGFFGHASRHGLLRAAWARIPSPGAAPFPQGIHGETLLDTIDNLECTLQVGNAPFRREYSLPGRDCAFPEGNGTLPVNPLNLADPPAAASRGEHTPAHAGRSDGSRPPSPSTAAHGRRNVSHPCAAAASRQCREQNRSAARQPPSA